MRNPFERRELQPDDFHLGDLFFLVWEGLFIVDAETTALVLANPQGMQMFGYSPDRIGKSVLGNVAEEDRQAMAEQIRIFARTGGGPLITYGRPYQRVVLHENGGPVPVSTTRVPLRCKRSRHRFFLSIVRDLSLPNTDTTPSEAFRHLGVNPLND